jgi:phosphatidylserine/phosphatidylglycerophosphate/cardiolipin synthase-like enzyme
MGADRISLDTLVEGGQAPAQVGADLADWVAQSRRTLDIAIYSFNAPGVVGDRIFAALRDASARGVAVRALVHRPDLPPSALHATAAPRTRVDVLRRTGVHIELTEQARDLMHHKFAVRDDEAVWCGSANWTLDDFGAQENLVMRVRSRELADAYCTVFAELWRSQQIEGTGGFDLPFLQVGDARVRPWFCPGGGRALSHCVADRVTGARRRVRIASPIVTAGPILSGLHSASQGNADMGGIIDLTQTRAVVRQWAGGVPTWKTPALEQVLDECHFSGKYSTEPGREGAPRNTMHAKALVADDTVFVGSFNFSRSGEQNAENVLEIEHAPTADLLCAWIDGLRERYPPLDSSHVSGGAA